MGDSDTSLVLSLKHPQPSVRMSAVEHLMGIITSGQVRHSYQNKLLLRTFFFKLIWNLLMVFLRAQVSAPFVSEFTGTSHNTNFLVP